jgi:hypothetical protein
MTLDDDVYQLAFDSQFFVDHAEQIRNPTSLARAIRDMDYATRNGTAHEVRLAWLQFYDLAGPILTGQFIASGAWRDYCPEIDDDTDTDSRATLWTDGSQRVVSQLRFITEVPCDMTFTVE